MRKGLQVILYDSDVESPQDIDDITNYQGRMYYIDGLGIKKSAPKYDANSIATSEATSVSITLRYYSEARKATSIPNSKTSSDTRYKPDGKFNLSETSLDKIKPIRKLSHAQFSAFVEGIDFEVSSTGAIKKI